MKTEAEIRKYKEAIERIVQKHDINLLCGCIGCQVKSGALCLLDWILDEAGDIGERLVEETMDYSRR